MYLCLACMQPTITEGFSKSDIDLFLVGINDQQEANEKVKNRADYRLIFYIVTGNL